MLKEAFENREALEEKIAQGRRNRKEAGNKYGMSIFLGIIIYQWPDFFLNEGF